MPNLTVFTNGKSGAASKKKVQLTNKNTGGPPVLGRDDIKVNYLWITTSGPSLVRGTTIAFTGAGSAGLTAVIMGSRLFGVDLVVWFYVYPATAVAEEYSVRILGLGDLVVTVETTGAPDSGTDSGITEGP